MSSLVVRWGGERIWTAFPHLSRGTSGSASAAMSRPDADLYSSKQGKGNICDQNQREPMLFTENCPRATGRTRLVFQLCCLLFFCSFLQAFEPQQLKPGDEGVKREPSFHIWLIFASKDWCWLLFSEALVVFKVVITNYSVQVKFWCVLEWGAIVGAKVVDRLSSPHSPLLLLSHAHSVLHSLCWIFCSFWEQSLVPPLFCGFSLNQCCHRGSCVHGRMGGKKSFESCWTRGTR